jgi:hypothetical protein
MTSPPIPVMLIHVSCNLLDDQNVEVLLLKEYRDPYLQRHIVPQVAFHSSGSADNQW